MILNVFTSAARYQKYTDTRDSIPIFRPGIDTRYLKNPERNLGSISETKTEIFLNCFFKFLTELKKILW